MRKILWEDWDPIGCGVPADEYDDYVWPVVKLLQEGAGLAGLVAYLDRTAASTIGCAVPESRNTAVAAKLLALTAQS